MNVITCAALMSLNLEVFANDKRIMFGICFLLCLIGLMGWSNFKNLMAESHSRNQDKAETAKLINEDSES